MVDVVIDTMNIVIGVTAEYQIREQKYESYASDRSEYQHVGHLLLGMGPMRRCSRPTGERRFDEGSTGKTPVWHRMTFAMAYPPTLV
jgi:hypothetical protein